MWWPKPFRRSGRNVFIFLLSTFFYVYYHRSYCALFDAIMIHLLIDFLVQYMLWCFAYACLSFLCVGFFYHFIIFLSYKIKLSTECWFCMQKTRVYIANRNSFICCHCQQYNGFLKDGSYNKTIEEQSDFNEFDYCQRSYSPCSYEQHRLCDSCNKYQEIKIKLFADFVPIDEENFDQEVIEFRKNVENLYRLCDNCEHLINKVLDKPSNLGFRKTSLATPMLNQKDEIDRQQKMVDVILSKSFSFFSFAFFILAYLVILVVLNYLFILSNNVYISKISANYNYFKKPFSESYSKFYRQYYVPMVSIVFSIYAILIYFGKTFYSTLDVMKIATFSALLVNQFDFNLFSFSHDSLVEFQQCLFVVLFILTLFDLCCAFYNRIFKNSFFFRKTPPSSGISTDFKRQNKDNKLFTFRKFDDDSRNIRRQIKDLSLTDFDSTISGTFTSPNDERTYVVNQANSRNNVLENGNYLLRTTYKNPFSVKTFSYGQIIDSPLPPFSYCQYKYSNSNILPMQSMAFNFGESNQFPEKSKTSLNFSIENSLTFNNKSPPISSPRVLNYIVNYQQHRPPTHPRLAARRSNVTSKLNLFLHMLHTFEVTLFLVIIGLFIVILSMPITLSYSSDFNYFDVNFILHNKSNN